MTAGAAPTPSADAGESIAGADPAVPAGRGTFRTRGHDRAVAALRAMLGRGVPHAILLGGPAGIGKTTLALDLAAALLCDDPDPAARPCRACRACRLVERERHPDVHRLAPAGPGDQIRIGTRERPEDGTVRRLAADMVLLPVEGGARVAIVERADRLTDDAQTALLKTLEEPPPGVTIMLCADDEDRLMPTVRSRTARIRLGPVAGREIEAILAESGSVDAPTAARLARLSGGRPGLALLLARTPEAIATRDELARTLLDLIDGSPATRLASVKDLTARATELTRALDRAARAGAVAEPATAGRRTRKGPSVGPEASPADADPAAGPSGGAEGDEGADPDAEPGGRLSASAAERRRAAIALVGVWREIARDLVVAALGEDRRVRDPALLDDLHAAASRLGDGAATAVGAFLRRLDTAGELLEANVRPELVLDGLVLGWPRATSSR
jgi:DNA polymerase-3 subunit delta'